MLKVASYSFWFNYIQLKYMLVNCFLVLFIPNILVHRYTMLSFYRAFNWPDIWHGDYVFSDGVAHEINNLWCARAFVNVSQQ